MTESAVAVDTATAQIQTTFNTKQIMDLPGSGGMGEVWKARDTRLGRIVAIKLLKGQHSERFE